jgi:hypothetical protein
LSPIDYSGEGPTDGLLAVRLIEAVGAEPGKDYSAGRRAHGKAALDASIPGLMAAARFGGRVLVLRDLDHDAACAGALVSRLAAARPQAFCLRIAVRSAEAWLLADRRAIAPALNVRVNLIPSDPEALGDPKARLRQIGGAAGNREARRLLGGSWQQAHGWIADFIRDDWQPRRAAAHSPSLTRALARLEVLAKP